MDPKLDKKSSKIFYCEKCDYTTSKQSQYDRHILTRKHKILTNTDTKNKKVPYQNKFVHVEKYTNIDRAYLHTKTL